ncbi:MAG: glycosyl transferase, family 2 [Gemmatimonadetes bacterium]|nr:glycosyl transferase, family 2 [Gemmatimonadota bacterium]
MTNGSLPSTPPLLCEHPLDQAKQDSFRVVCGVCGSFWDLESRAADIAYDASYPAERGHFDPRVGALKMRTLSHWLDSADVVVKGKRVCEVGFGGGTCLPLLAQEARHVLGIEANATTIAHAKQAGYRAELLLIDELPARLDEPVDLWIFQDAFEHIPDPAPFVDWMRDNSSPGAEILLVAPRADSLSQTLMGRLWLHKLPDHLFHWSQRGLVEFMSKRGFALRTDFFPLKYISPQMAIAHALHKAGVADGARKWLGGTALAVPFNFGEMGLVFRAASS